MDLRSPDRHSRLSTITELTERTEPSRHWPSRQQLVAMNNPRALSSSETTSSYGKVIGVFLCRDFTVTLFIFPQNTQSTSQSCVRKVDIHASPLIQIVYLLPLPLLLSSDFQVMTPHHLFTRRQSQRFNQSHQSLLHAPLALQCQQRITSQIFQTSRPGPARSHLQFLKRTRHVAFNPLNAPNLLSWQAHVLVQYLLLVHRIWRPPLYSHIRLCDRLLNLGFR